MKPIEHDFEKGQSRFCPSRGPGVVVDIKDRAGVDTITVLYLGGLDTFLAGSMAAREWKKEASP